MKRRKHEYFLIALDCLLINLAFVLALELHAPSKVLFFPYPPFVDPAVLFMMVYTWLIITIFNMNQLYNMNAYLTVSHQIHQLVLSLLLAVIGIGVLSFFTKFKVIVDSRLVLTYFFLLSLGLLSLVRIGIFRSVFRQFAYDIAPRSVLIIGADVTGKRLASQLIERNPFGLQVAGFLDDAVTRGTTVIRDCEVLGRIDEVESVVARHAIDEIVICLENQPELEYLDLLERCAATRAMVLVASEQFSVIPQRTTHEIYGNVPVFGVMNAQPYMGQPAFKQVGDFVLASVMVLFFLPIILLIALAIKIDSPGPVLFRQVRIGKGGKSFNFFKFRSMYVGSDRDKERELQIKEFIQENAGTLPGSTKIVDTRKITRVGKYLRRTSLDELPQLFNVLRGEMSLVGPRPCLPYEWNNYAEWHKRRLSVTPGCTGLWQVLGRSKVGFRDMVILDLYYVHNVSFKLDLWLLLKTVPVMIFGTGGK